MQRNITQKKLERLARHEGASVFGPGAGARVRVAAAAVGAALCRRRAPQQQRERRRRRRRGESRRRRRRRPRRRAARRPEVRERGVVERRGARLAQVDVAPAAAVVQHLERAALAVGLAERAGAGGAARRQRVGVGRALGGERRAETEAARRAGVAPEARPRGDAPRERRDGGLRRRRRQRRRRRRRRRAGRRAAAAPTPTRSARTRPGSRCSCSRRATCRTRRRPRTSRPAPRRAARRRSAAGRRRRRREHPRPHELEAEPAALGRDVLVDHGHRGVSDARRARRQL